MSEKVSYLVTWTNPDGGQSGREYDDAVQASAVAGWWRDREALPVKVERRTY